MVRVGSGKSRVGRLWSWISVFSILNGIAPVGVWIVAGVLGLVLNLAGPGELTPVAEAATGNIAIANVTVTEGNSGATNAVFNVTLTKSCNQSPVTACPSTVGYSIGGGTATSGVDYTSAGSGTLSF